jgi:hypothetical protein
MADDSKPSQPEQISSAAIASAPPAVHELTARDYLLGSPVFAAPALAQTHQLSAEGYLTGSLIWSTAAIRLGHVHWGSAGGRPIKISDDLAAKLIPMVEQFVVEKQLTSSLKLMGTSTLVVNYARKLAGAEGITNVADLTLIRQVTRPAVKNIRDKSSSSRKSDVN